jgi:hypothetical protein
MKNPAVASSRQFYARVAGFTVLFYMAVGFTSVSLYSQATDAEGTSAILTRITAHATALRMTVLLELLECFSALVLAVTLYRITRDESNELAMLAMICRVCECVLAAIGIKNTIGLLWLANGGAGNGATTGTIGSFILMPAQSSMIGAPFFALGSMIFAYLLLRGRSIPVVLAWLGVLASAVLVVGVPLQLAGFIKAPLTLYLWLPMLAYQVPLGFWLLIKGVAAPVRNDQYEFAK